MTVQIVNSQTGTKVEITDQIPFDNSIPQNTEGDEIMSASITPTDANNKLKIDVVINGALDVNNINIVGALFQDSIADALAAAAVRSSVGHGVENIKFSHFMPAGTTSPITFKVRAGPSGATRLTFNGTNGNARFGGVMASSITITEYA